MRRADTIIIGGGVSGCAIAFRLAQSGVGPTIIFEKSGLATGATGICPGGIRQQFAGEADCVLARRSMSFWNRINEILKPDEPFHFERSGYLFLADSQEVLARLRSNVEMQNRLGVPSRILSPAQISDLLPDIQGPGLAGGAFCQEDGFIEECDRVTRELARCAKEGGVEIVFEEVTGLSGKGGLWEVHSSKSSWLCCNLILAAGVETARLAGQLGVELPIERQMRRLAFTEPYERAVMLPLVVALERGFAGKQLLHGVFYLGFLEEDPAMDDLEFMERCLRSGASLLPILGELGVRRILQGEYDNTPDRRPLLGPLRGREGLHVAAGSSGHGFMIAPAVAEIICASVTGKPTDLPVEAFSPQRFEGRTARREGLVI